MQLCCIFAVTGNDNISTGYPQKMANIIYHVYVYIMGAAGVTTGLHLERLFSH